MIRSLRNRHRATIAAMCLIVTPLFVLAIRAQGSATQADTPQPSTASPLAVQEIRKGALAVSFELQQEGAGRTAYVRPLEQHCLPELLLYLSRTASTDSGLPPDARYLAPLGTGATVPLTPEDAGAKLHLFHLAHGRVVATFDIN